MTNRFCLSYNAEIKSGITQGSIPGHILFNLFINDLPISINSHIKIFADDTTIDQTIGK